MSIFLLIFFIGTAVDLVVKLLLAYSDFVFRKKHGHEIPEVAKPYVDQQTVEKACLYEDANYRSWIPEYVLTSVIGVYLVLCGFYPALFAKAWNWSEGYYLTAIIFMLGAELPVFILHMPFAIYNEFSIEKFFGFSQMTLGMWISDLIKSLLVGSLLFIPLISAVVFIFVNFPQIWWVLLGLIYLLFSMGISLIYPILIAPIFNKFTPLEEGELRTRLEALLKKCGFKSSGLYVMDASRRSGHSNAYFTGFGKSKRVVLYDTLIQQMTPEEIEAVLGHELGHYKKHHIIKRLLVVFPLTFVFLYFADYIIRIPELYQAFGFKITAGTGPEILLAGLFLLTLVLSGAEVFLEPVANYFSRRDEFQADTYSKQLLGTPEPLISALIKLNKENLSELQVPKLYSLFYYSHPPLLERIEALRK